MVMKQVIFSDIYMISALLETIYNMFYWLDNDALLSDASLDINIIGNETN